MTIPRKHQNGINRPWQKIRRRIRPRGAAVVELAVTVPLLSLLAFGIVEYSQLSHAAQVVSNASRRGARFAAKNENSSAAAVESYIRSYITESFANLTAEQANTAVQVSVADGSDSSIVNGDLSTTSSGTPVVVDVSLDFDSIRVLPHFGVLDNQVVQTSTSARRE